MLPYGLAIAVGLSSFILFVTAFFMPKIHRQDDFFWSGLGFFYALVLWFCASQIKGAVLLGQLAAVALLISYSWQVIKLRKAVVDPSGQTSLNGFSVTGFIGGFFNRSPRVKQKIEQSKEEVTSGAGKARKENIPIAAVTEDNILEETVEIVSDARGETAIKTQESKDDTVIQAEELDQSTVNEDVAVETATEDKTETESTTSSSISDKTEKKAGLFSKFLNFGKKESKSTPDNNSSITNTKLDELLDENDESEATSENQVANVEETKVEETIVAETVIEEETNWDFLDEELEATPEETSNKGEELVADSVNKSAEETIEPTTSIDSEKPVSEEETK